MDLICPDCRGDLQMTSVRWAVCAQHGGRYEVLFDRDAAPVPQEMTGAMCETHPRQAAVGSCPACNRNLCTLCSFDVNGRSFCGDCAIAAANTQAGGNTCPSCGLSLPAGITQCDCGYTMGLLNLSTAVPKRGRASLGPCGEHPEVEAVARCQICFKMICGTCDFALPGGVHLCPECVEKDSSGDVSPKRKRQSYIALALAIWSTILIVLMFTGAFNSLFQDPETGTAADLIITNLTLWPLLIGTGLSLGAMDKKLKNTGLMKAVAWWNGILAALFLLLVIGANLGLIGG